ncbi:sperm-associated antigen 17-like [Cottoperca gobio]|uniref:Sperm-associated antigen 17-like n=1 Tax=Cottoperca gobio TaxID=56716 RepID=A0A6J2RPE3_COTGO|nr:sperm-associated antigen 17-like [Cottoperca gobio]
MPPKAAKRVSDKKPNASGAAVVSKNWEAGLTRAPFEEESWQGCVSLVVGSSPEEEEELTQALSLAIKKPQRKLFNLLTWDSTLTKIHELGNLKAKRHDDVPMFYEVTEPAKVLLDAGEEIPCDLMANILKFQLLQIKAHDQLLPVEISTEQYLSRATEEPKLHDGPGLDFELVSFMLQSFLPLVHTEEERSHMLKSLLTTAQNEEDQKV